MEWLNYHHLLYFWTVASEGGLAPAGKRLKLSQSAISGQIRRLEERLGHRLFEKQGRKLALTDTGQVVFRYAEQIFGLGRELLDAVHQRPIDRPTRLVVGVSDVVPKLMVRELLAPALVHVDRLICHEDRFDRLLGSLAAHVLDVVIADAPVPRGSDLPLFDHLLGQSKITVVAPAALAPALRKGFPASMHGAPVLLPITGSVLRRDLDHWFERQGIAPQIVAEAEDSALLKAFAADGMGAIFVPSAVASLVARRYELGVVAELAGITERYYAITGGRRIVHPGVLEIRRHARAELH